MKITIEIEESDLLAGTFLPATMVAEAQGATSRVLINIDYAMLQDNYNDVAKHIEPLRHIVKKVREGMSVVFDRAGLAAHINVHELHAGHESN